MHLRITKRIRTPLLLVLLLTFSLCASAQKSKADEFIKQAVAFCDKKEYDQAIQYCNQALDYYPQSAWAFNVRGTAYNNKGNYDQAIKEYSKAIELDQKYALAYYNRGVAYNDKGDYNQAIRDYSKAVELDPKYALAYYNRGLAYYYKGDYDQAIKDYSKAIELDPNYANAYNNRGLAYDYKGDYDQAIEDYNKAVELNSKDALAYYNRGLAYYYKGDYDQAIKDYSKAIELDAKYALAYYNRGLAYNNKGDYDQAIKDYSKAIELDPKYANAYNNRGVAYKNKVEYDQAIKDYSKAIELDPKHALAYNNRGLAYYYKGEYDQAIKEYSKAIELDPKYANAYNNWGLVYYYKGDYDQAIKDYSKAIELDPKYANANYNRGLAYYYKGDYDQAIKDYSKAIELDSKDALAYNNRGLAYYYKGDYNQAIKDYNACLSIEPLHKYALLNICPCLIRLNRFDEAATIYNKYKSNNIKGYIEYPDWEYYKLYLNAATLYVKNNRYIEALTELKTAENTFTSYNTSNKNNKSGAKKSYADILALKGYIQEKLNRAGEAEDTYNQALVINTNQLEIVKRLKELKSRQIQLATMDNSLPVIELYSPAPSSTLTILSDNGTTQLVGRVKDPSGIAKVSINGKAVPDVEGDGLFISTLSMKQGMNIITIVATDKTGKEATKEFTVTCKAITDKTESLDIPTFNSIPKYYAILIGENNYSDPQIEDLKNPVKDALKLKRVLESNYTFTPSNIDTLFNRSREEIMEVMIQRCNTLKENDNLLIFFAGHGAADKDFKGDIDGYLVPSSAKKGNYSSYISTSDIVTALKRSKAKHILLIADACFSGSLTRELSPDAPMNIQEVYRKQSRKVMASGNISPVPDNSVFMFFLVKRLEENKEKYLRAKSLFNALEKSVDHNSESEPQFSAIKGTGDEGGDFVLIKKINHISLVWLNK